MNVLALDSSTRSCSVAVAIDGRAASEVSTVSNRTHSLHLMGMVRDALELAEVGLKEILELLAQSADRVDFCFVGFDGVTHLMILCIHPRISLNEGTRF